MVVLATACCSLWKWQFWIRTHSAWWWSGLNDCRTAHRTFLYLVHMVHMHLRSICLKILQVSKLNWRLRYYIIKLNRLSQNNFKGNGVPHWNWRTKYLKFLSSQLSFWWRVTVQFPWSSTSCFAGSTHSNFSNKVRACPSKVKPAAPQRWQTSFLFNWHGMGSPQLTFLAKHSCNRQFASNAIRLENHSKNCETALKVIIVEIVCIVNILQLSQSSVLS